MSIEKNYNDNVDNPSEDRLILPSDANLGYEELEASVPVVRPKFTYNGVAYKSVVDLIKSEKVAEQPAVEEKTYEFSEETKKFTQRFMQKLHNGDFDEEFNKRRQAEIGYGEPMELTPENIAKEVEKFGQTLEWLADIMPDEFGPCKRTEREESTDLVDKVAVLCTEQLSQTTGPQRTRLKKHKPTDSK